MKKIKPYIIALSVGTLLSIILTWPLMPNIASYYTDHGDYPIAGSMLWYNTQSLVSGKIFNRQEYLKGYQFYGQPYSAVFINHSIVPSFIFAPIYLVTGSLPFSVNLYAILTLILSFMAAFYVSFHLTKNLWASLVGAFIFTFNPPTMVRFPHHLDILGKYFLPLVFLFGYRFFTAPTIKLGFLFGLFFTLNALTVNYYLIFSLVMLPILALPFIIAKIKRGEWGGLGKYGKCGAVGLVFLPILLYFILPYSQFSIKEGVSRPLEATPFFSARINDYFSASPDNLLYGGWVKSMETFREPKDNRGILNYEEHTLFIGFVVLGLLFIGLIKGGHGPERGEAESKGLGKWYFSLLLVVPFILSFGPYFNGMDEGLPLPFYYLHKIAPFLMEGIRSPSRFEILLLVPLSIIASFGAAWLIKKRGIWVIGVIGVILIAENFTVKSYDNRSEALAQVSSELKFLSNTTTLHLPIYMTDDADEFGKNSAYLNWLTKTGERIFNGNSAYLPPDQLGLLFEFKQNLDEKSLQKLSLLGVNYIVIHQNLLQATDMASLSRNSELLGRAVVFKDANVRIIDLSKYSFNTPLCSLEQDFDITLGKVEEIDMSLSYSLVLQNRNDCYLVSLFGDRYRQMDNTHFRLPLLIGPKEQVILSEVNKELRVR